MTTTFETSSAAAYTSWWSSARASAATAHRISSPRSKISQGHAAQARAVANEALTIANCCEYRLKQADIHNFMAQMALDEAERLLAEIERLNEE